MAIAIGVGVGGGILLIAIIVIIVVCCLRRKKAVTTTQIEIIAKTNSRNLVKPSKLTSDNEEGRATAMGNFR